MCLHSPPIVERIFHRSDACRWRFEKNKLPTGAPRPTLPTIWAPALPVVWAEKRSHASDVTNYLKLAAGGVKTEVGRANKKMIRKMSISFSAALMAGYM